MQCLAAIEMKELAVYLLLVLGGKASPSAAEVSAAGQAVGITVDEAAYQQITAALADKVSLVPMWQTVWLPLRFFCEFLTRQASCSSCCRTLAEFSCAAWQQGCILFISDLLNRVALPIVLLDI
jgi:hypothetical protein